MATARALDSLLLWREGAGRAGGSNSEMRMMELQSRRMSETVAEVQKKSANKLAIGVQRCGSGVRAGAASCWLGFGWAKWHSKVR